MTLFSLRRTVVGLLAGTALSLGLAATSFAADAVTLSFLVDNAPSTVASAKELVAQFTAKNPTIKIDLETRPGGAEGDNLIKTKLATGDMSDVFEYNSGSLFQAMNPKQNLVDLTDDAAEANVLDVFKTVVTAEGRVYGVPVGGVMGGGILYNRKIYADLGLKVPKSWDEFKKNNDAIKAKGGIAPVIQTFKDTWTSQLFILGDFFNVQAAEPNFAADYTANKAKYATSAAARKGFDRQADVLASGYLNADYASATFNDGMRMVAKGEGAHYPMLTFAIGSIATDYKDKLNDVGFFAIPGDKAESNGLTTWMPAGIYVPKTTKHPTEAKACVAFIASTEGCDAQTKAAGVTGPYAVKGCKLPAGVPPAVADLIPYFEKPGMAAPALEFVSPVKGPSLEQITVEVGSGIRKPADAAALYDEDVRKQALQLGLPGWK